MKALLSIKPEYADAIFSGDKVYEYRKVIFRKKVEIIQVYVTKPVGKIVGEFTVDFIISGTPMEIWEKTHLHSGIDEKIYFDYFHGRNSGYAIKVKNCKKYNEPICPFIEYNNFIAPQSFKYIF